MGKNYNIKRTAKTSGNTQKKHERPNREIVE